MSNLKETQIAILTANEYEDLELWYPKLRLIETGANVLLIGSEKKTYSSKHGYEAEADAAISDIYPKDFDAVIIPGGYSPDHLRRDPKMVKFVKDIYEQGGIVAAICHGGWMLASADIVNGKNVTCFFAIKDDLIHAGANYKDEEVIQDGQIITSRIPQDLPAFCKKIINALKDQKVKN